MTCPKGRGTQYKRESSLIVLRKRHSWRRTLAPEHTARSVSHAWWCRTDHGSQQHRGTGGTPCCRELHGDAQGTDTNQRSLQTAKTLWSCQRCQLYQKASLKCYIKFCGTKCMGYFFPSSFGGLFNLQSS